MIHSLEILKPGETPIKWLGGIKALPKKFEFKEGLNILWGANGSGKTTILRLLARLFHCEQSGRSVVTETSLNDVFSFVGILEKRPIASALKSVHVVHDGQPVLFFDPSHAVGLLGGGAAFDDDFFSEGVRNLTTKGSSGEMNKHRFGTILEDFLLGKKLRRPEFRVKRNLVNDLWKERIDLTEGFFKENAEGPKGPPTLLFDEPDRSLDIPYQAKFWTALKSVNNAKGLFIVASHSVFALNIPNANYIEMSPGYLKASQEAVNGL